MFDEEYSNAEEIKAENIPVSVLESVADMIIAMMDKALEKKAA